MNLKISLFLILLSSILYAQVNYPQSIFQASWGTSPSQVQQRIAPDSRYGPQAFRVIDEKVIILDGQNEKLKIFDPSGMSQSVNVSNLARDFYFNSQDDYILLFDNKVETYQRTKISRTEYLNQRQVIKPLGENFSTHYPVRFSNGQRIDLSPSANLQKTGYNVNVIRVNNAIGEIRLNNSTSNSSSFSIEFQQKNLASLRYAGSDANGRLFIEVELFIQQVPLKIERQLQVFTPVGKHLATYGIPINNYCSVFRDIEIDKRGNLYQMYFDSEGMKIWKWEWPAIDSDRLPIIFEMPDFGSTNFEIESLETTQPSNLTKVTDLPQVTPEVALAIADTYVQLSWQCTAENLTNGLILDPDGNYVQTPDWLYIGAIQRMPYKWGGFDTIDSFLQGIEEGYYAGDRATKLPVGDTDPEHGTISDYARGVDCSGYVSRCWTLPTHYSTRMMDDYITQPYESWEQTLPGDACHIPGHVRLIVEHQADGSIDMVEAAGFNWRVSYTNYHYSDITAYTPRYYINMQGTPGNIPQPLLASFLVTDQANLDWTVSGQDNIAHYNLYISSNASDWNYEQTLSADARNHSLEVADSDVVFYKIRSVSATNEETEGLPSDGYGIYKNDQQQKVLIVDAFDRTSATTGSWNHIYHDFAAIHGKALLNLRIPFETVPNETVIDGGVSLNNYAGVIWVSGDESTNDTTFNSIEQNLIRGYLEQGGRLFVSGSEIGWDLDSRGTTEDKAFYNNILKADYVLDDAGSYIVSGTEGTPFAGLTLHYDDGNDGVYEEDYPDAITPINGSNNVLTYANDRVAAIAYTGSFNGSTQDGQIVYMGFPFETIYLEAERNALMNAIMNYFNLLPTAISETEGVEFPNRFTLLPNYPNPFNAMTNLNFFTPTSGEVLIRVSNSRGQIIDEFNVDAASAGHQKYRLNANGWSSGIYFYNVSFKSTGLTSRASGKLILIK